MEDKTEASKNLEFTVIPQLAFADKNGRIVISQPKHKKKGHLVGAKNKVTGDKVAFVAIAEPLKLKRT